MSTKFEWQTEEDADWDDLPPEPAPEPPSLRRRWWLGLFLVGLIIVAAVLFSQQASDRLEQVTIDLQEDITAVYELLHSAGSEGDVDLFRTMLSARDQTWTDAQLELVETGTFHQREAFGLVAAEAETADLAAPVITLSTDLQSAELVAPQTYTTRLPSGEEIEVKLLQTAVFRQGARAWLFAPPLDDFWGEWQETEGEIVAVTYPARDTAVAQRLSTDLDNLLQIMCHSFDDLNCPDDYRLRLRLETTPDTLLVSNRPVPVLEAQTLTLPAPTLVGLPQDNEGYQALYRGYAAHLASVAISDIIGYDCCRRAPFYSVLLEWQLSDLDLRPWPPVDVNYNDLYDNWRARTAMNTLWSVENLRNVTSHEYGHYLISFIDLLREEAGKAVTPLSLMRLVNEASSYEEWLGTIETANDLNGPILQTRWLEIVAKRAGVNNEEPPPTPFPGGVVEMVCQNETGPAMVVHFNPQSREWDLLYSHTFSSDVQGWINTLPMPDTYILYTRNSSNEFEQTVIRNGRTLFSLQTQEGEQTFVYSRTFWPWHTGFDNERFLTLSRNEADETMSYEFIDLDSCQDGVCSTIPLVGIPIYSPDGSRLLMQEDNRIQPDLPTLFIAGPSGENPQLLEPGRSPVWLSTDRYAYLRPAEDGGEELITAVVDQESPTVLLNLERLLVEISPDDAGITALDVNIHPASARMGPERLLLSARSRFSGEPGPFLTYIFLVDLPANPGDDVAVTLINRDLLNPDFIHPSPNGRWLALFQFNDGLTLVDLDTNERERRPFDQTFSFTWVGNDWLMTNRTDDVLFLHVDAGYRLIVPHELGFCWQGRWLPAPVEDG